MEVKVLYAVPQDAVDRCLELPGMRVDNGTSVRGEVTDGVHLCFIEAWPNDDRETLTFATLSHLSGMLFRERIAWQLLGLDFADD